MIRGFALLRRRCLHSLARASAPIRVHALVSLPHQVVCVFFCTRVLERYLCDLAFCWRFFFFYFGESERPLNCWPGPDDKLAAAEERVSARRARRADKITIDILVE